MYPMTLVGISLLLQSATAPSPYTGEETRAIRSLSPQQIDGYLNARGMGLARAAELNSYPGPMHVLELSEQLELTPQQLEQTRVAFDAMKARATELGRQIVERERALDRAFAEKTIDQESLHEMVLELGRLQAELRFTHLAAHLKMRDILTPEQVEHYDELRGYRKER